MNTKSILVLDAETIGLDKNSRIIEISTLDHNGHPLINTLINPGVPIPKDAYAVHGIDDAMVRDAPTWAEVSDSILGLLQQCRLLIYNAPYDLRLLCQSERFATGRELQPTDFDATCVMQLAMDVIDTEGHRIRLRRDFGRVSALGQTSATGDRYSCTTTWSGSPTTSKIRIK